ncbi:DUF1223 domain-containing protein [Agarilytica rhodophyticola]|uniref:DUF1223 domain-containing protein n=1 Tax=Agarilytica rhodophyticola TaxID=1737490 RepID=UPI000B349D2A|nr:DUF1223 domain-containing protein [Agarilytica rhodophyticola]
MKFYITFLFTLLTASATFAEPESATKSFNSGEKQVQLIELFTSEGCSSCPPADRWMSSLTQKEELWSRYVPIAFHVDYWNYLGWKDPFSSSSFSQRQRKYQRYGNINSVYTPGFVVAGKEWRSWFGLRRELPEQRSYTPGNLKLTVNGDRYHASFKSNIGDQVLSLHVALLGMDISTDVPRGENAGKKLNHDFVALSLDSNNSKSNIWQGQLPKAPKNAGDVAVAAWVTTINNPTPIQAVGGFLP